MRSMRPSVPHRRHRGCGASGAPGGAGAFARSLSVRLGRRRELERERAVLAVEEREARGDEIDALRRDAALTQRLAAERDGAPRARAPAARRRHRRRARCCSSNRVCRCRRGAARPPRRARAGPPAHRRSPVRSGAIRKSSETDPCSRRTYSRPKAMRTAKRGYAEQSWPSSPRALRQRGRGSAACARRPRHRMGGDRARHRLGPVGRDIVWPAVARHRLAGRARHGPARDRRAAPVPLTPVFGHTVSLARMVIPSCRPAAICRPANHRAHALAPFAHPA